MDAQRTRIEPQPALYPLVDLDSITGHLSDWVREYRTHADLRVEYPDGYDPILIRPDGREVDTWRLDYPYDNLLRRAEYDPTKRALQIELLKLQSWAKETDARLVIVFEGRDAAGKGSTIKRFIQHLNPRGVRVVALNKPNKQERTSWYFQRYVAHLPSAGEFVLFDRSWYNRATVEPVMGYCTDEEYRLFLRQAPLFERMLVQDGIILVKFWFSVSRAEQLTRFVIRDVDPVRRWKLSPNDLASLDRWDAYTRAKEAMFTATHTERAPWTVVNGNGKRLARLEAMRFVLSQVDYAGKNTDLVGVPDPLIVGPPRMAGAPGGSGLASR
ncbi:polyphosphate kinase 2 [Actinospica durhamensis]|uniref:ADP/GDP-polyphosphate phosphotransferase n=1 Tax=Actinospica durhamensis TaxID=1508375 RepID=A0A941EKU9_9ACTN|nr:polyphosphate kinase 2 [Actinospica durhamensis]MBR7832733.1 polyphosphate kinase 2 [Actinospica durhamensis]